jgi:hypothetical protein
MSDRLTTEEVACVAEFRAALRRFLRTTERNARSAGLTDTRRLYRVPSRFLGAIYSAESRRP